MLIILFHTVLKDDHSPHEALVWLDLLDRVRAGKFDSVKLVPSANTWSHSQNLVHEG